MHDGSDVAPLVLKLAPEVLELKIWYILLGRSPVVNIYRVHIGALIVILRSHSL